MPSIGARYFISGEFREFSSSLSPLLHVSLRAKTLVRIRLAGYFRLSGSLEPNDVSGRAVLSSVIAPNYATAMLSPARIYACKQNPDKGIV